ncbi:hypothetical protein [Nonomuraea typhae]|uniref:Thymidylate kinase n=1 Tax=Nonomuraea typhae TaxID=2603600 RepID=A0ABW7ZC86_9ACTN
MGIDGAGKTTLLEYVRPALAEAGIECVDTSKRPAIRSVQSNEGFPARSLERLWLELWRLLLGGGRSDSDQLPADTAIPLQFTDQTKVASGWITDALPADVTGVRRSGLVASGLTELAIDQLIRAEIIEPVLARGAVAMLDAFGFKPTLIRIAIAREIADDTMSGDALDQFEAVLRAAYSTSFLQPDIGFLLDADPQRSYEWRMRQEGRLGVSEDLWLAGRKGGASYLALQTIMADKLRTAAVDWGWHILKVDGRPQRETADEAVEIMMHDAGMRRLIEQPAGD